jgi:hypothetical protein
MAAAEVPAYLERVPCYAQMAGRFLGARPAALAEWLLADLERAGAMRIEGGIVRPTMAA